MYNKYTNAITWKQDKMIATTDFNVIDLKEQRFPNWNQTNYEMKTSLHCNYVRGGKLSN